MKIKDKKTGKIVDVRLPKAFKAKWLKALRSGKYIQGEGSLELLQLNEEGNNIISHCCLGVACRIQYPKLKLRDVGLITEDFKKKHKILKVPKLLVGGNFKGDEDYNLIVDKLSGMNDSGKSFKHIANYIEKYL